MPAYVISLVSPLDERALARYRDLAAASIAAYGGRYLVRGAAPDVLEGVLPAPPGLPSGARPDAPAVVVVEFPTVARVREWYASPEYAEALAVRRTALDRVLVLADGVPA